MQEFDFTDSLLKNCFAGGLRKLQKSFTCALDAETRFVIMEEADVPMRARINSAGGSGLALRPPTHASFVLLAHSWRGMVLRRLGIPLRRGIPEGGVICPCGFLITKDNLNVHLSTCNRLISAERTNTHNKLTATMQGRTQLINVYSERETKHWQDGGRVKGGRTDLEFYLPETKNLEVDLSVVSSEAKNVVTVTACLGGSECKHLALGCGSAQRALNNAERRKNIAHAAAVSTAGKTFLPFVMSSFGAFSPSSFKVISRFAKMASEYFPSQWRTPAAWALNFKTALVFELHRENSCMWDAGWKVLLRSLGRRGLALDGVGVGVCG